MQALGCVAGIDVHKKMLAVGWAGRKTELSLQLINSPVDATVNGQPAAVINAVGWPGLADTYRVDIKDSVCIPH